MFRFHFKNQKSEKQKWFCFPKKDVERLILRKGGQESYAKNTAELQQGSEDAIFKLYSLVLQYLDSDTIFTIVPLYTNKIDLKQNHQDVMEGKISVLIQEVQQQYHINCY